ncbi:MAG: PQQ-binding-like beta-propeller repeat protein [Pirellulales bacterium]|nr:PQQ-binding-like beta-propeller repeat protein [Pirellulales bacterium]
MFRLLLTTCLVLSTTYLAAAEAVKHSLLAMGKARRAQLIGEDGKVTFTFPHGASDGHVLANGNLLLALYPDQTYPRGAVVEVDPTGKVVWTWHAKQKEVSTAQLLDNGNILSNESGANPCLVEVNRKGDVVVRVPLECQKKNAHMQTRMARKLPNGNYLVPHLLEKEVREYTPDSKIVWRAKTPNWPFTAIRLDNGNTLIGCTVGNVVVEVDKDGKIVWQVDNKDLGKNLIADACGVQRLPNGNTVITSYRARKGVKLIEVDRDKNLVWTFNDGTPHGIHHFQILTTNGKPVEGRALR